MGMSHSARRLILMLMLLVGGIILASALIPQAAAYYEVFDARRYAEWLAEKIWHFFFP